MSAAAKVLDALIVINEAGIVYERIKPLVKRATEGDVPTEEELDALFEDLQTRIGAVLDE